MSTASANTSFFASSDRIVIPQSNASGQLDGTLNADLLDCYEWRLGRPLTYAKKSGANLGLGTTGKPWAFRGGVMLNVCNTEATKAAITEDRWFKTGDILTRDSEGYFAVVDRKKELIKYKVS